MNRFLISLIAIVGCISCRKPFNVQHFHETVFIDSVSLDTTLKPRKKDTQIRYYPVYYTGPLQDTIHLGEKLPSHGENKNFQDFVLRSLDEVTLTVDTSIKLNNLTIFESYRTGDDTFAKRVDSIIKEPAYAIILQNRSDSTLFLGHFNYLRSIVMQYQDKSGKWKDVEKAAFAYDTCLTFAKNIVVGPKQILVAKLIEYEGNFAPLCRLKLMNFDQTCYSNTFHFKLDKSIINQN
ncbi:hypothetical protein [Pedobacter sp.]